MKLPASLRGSTHFGDDVLDSSELSQKLLATERTFVGSAGTLILFDGSAGIHRGALVHRGERWALQIGLQATQGGARKTVPGLVGRMRYYLHRAKRLLLSSDMQG
jgi:hypothetical protein